MACEDLQLCVRSALNAVVMHNHLLCWQPVSMQKANIARASYTEHKFASGLARVELKGTYKGLPA